MLAAAADAVWNGARGWLTPPVLFVLINLVIGTIAVMSRLMSATTERGDDGRAAQRSLMRAPSVAFDRLRCFSFSSLGVPPVFDDGAAVEAASPVHAAPDGGEWRRMSLLRAPSVAFDRLRSLSFSRSGPAAEDAPVAASEGAKDAEPSRPAPEEEAGMMVEHEQQAHIERSQSEAAAEAPARRRRRARKSGREERAADGRHGTATEAPVMRRHELPPPVEVDERADDFIRQFREQLRLQRLDSILRYNDTLRRTGTV